MTLSPPLAAASPATAPSTLSLNELLPALPSLGAGETSSDAASAEHLAAATHVRSALRIPRDRALLLRTEEEWRRASAAPSWSHPPSPAHERALLTSLATLMRLKASESNGDATLLISRTSAALNPTPIHEMFAPPSPPAVRLLPRPGASSDAPAAQGPSAAISAGAPLQIMRRAPASSSSRTSTAASRPAPPSISEREAAYRAARERIFGAPSADDAESAAASSSSLRKEPRAARASPQPPSQSQGELSHEASAWTGYPLAAAGDARASGDTDAFSPFAPSAPTSRSASAESSGLGPASGTATEAYSDARIQHYDPGMDARHSYGAAQPGYGPAGAYWPPPGAAAPHAAMQGGPQNGSQWAPAQHAPWGVPPAHMHPGAWNGGAAGPSRPPQAAMSAAYGEAQQAAPPSRLDLPGALGRRQQAGAGRLYDPNSSGGDSQSRTGLSGRLTAASSANNSGNASPALRSAHVSGPVMRTLPPTFVMPSTPASAGGSSSNNTSPGAASPSSSQGRRAKVLPHPSLPARPDWVTLTPPAASSAPSISTPGSSSSGSSSAGPTSRDGASATSGASAANGARSGRSTPSGASSLPRPPHIAHPPHHSNSGSGSGSTSSSTAAAAGAAHLPPNPTLTWDAPVAPSPAPPHVRRPTGERSSPSSLPRPPASASLPPTPQPASSNGPPSRSSADFPPLGGAS